MPKFQITSPDGKTYEVTAPDGASQDDAIAYVQKNLYHPAPVSTGPAPDPSEGGGTLQFGPFDTGIHTPQVVDRVLSGVGKSFADLGLRAQQLAGIKSSAEVDQSRSLDGPLMRTGAGITGNIGGTLAMMAPAAIAAGASIPAAIGLGAAQGFATPTGANDSTLGNVALGGALGAAGPIAFRTGKAAYQGGKALLEPFAQGGRERIAGRVLDRFASDPGALQGLQPATSLTGATPTLAEATKDTGLASLQRSLESQDPQIAALFAQRAAANNAARVNALQGIAGDDAARAAATAARQEATGPLYRQANSATYQVDAQMADLLQRPAVRQALSRAQTMAANQGRPFGFTTETSAPFSGVGGARATQQQQITGQGLQDLKGAMDEMLSDPTSGFTGKAGNTIRDLRGQVVNWMEQQNPAYQDARTQYAALTKPLNQMDVGQRLLDKTTGAMRDLQGNPQMQASAFSRALNDEQGLVRKATGFKGVNSLNDVMTPQQLDTLNALRTEMETSARLGQAANGAGSQTAKSLASQNLMRQVIGPTGLPQSWAESALLESLLRPVQFAAKAAEPRIQETLARGLLDPSYASSLLTAARGGAPINPRLLQGMGLLSSGSQVALPTAGLLSAQR